MRRLLITLCCILLYSNALARHERDTLGTGTAVSFVQNVGQWHPRVRYEAQLHDAALFVEEHCLTVALRQRQQHPAPADGPMQCHAYRMHFEGTTGCMPEGLFEQEDYYNYYLDANPANWRSGVKGYDAVRYRGLYLGVDLEVYGGMLALKYNFIVHPDGDASRIVLRYEGTEGVSVESGGSLRIRTSVRDVVELKPYVYQVDDAGREVEIGSRWRTKSVGKGDYKVWVEVDAYDHRRDLVIDPRLIFSTYTGSTADNWGTTSAYDSKKNVYTAGLVFNIGYPVSTGAYQPSLRGGCDVGIFKFDSSGSQRLYATYLGGGAADMPHSMFVNSFDELLVLGSTGSVNFPVTAGAYQTSFAGGSTLLYFGASIEYPTGSDLFVSRFSTDGTQLQASTFVGGSANDGLNYRQTYNRNLRVMMAGNDSLYYNYGDGARGEIITDNLNNVYVGSTTFSNDFPTTAGCVQPASSGKQEGVVFKLDYNLRHLLWSTYLGGREDDAVYSIDVDSAYNLLVCGGTNSPNFPVTEGAHQTNYGGGTADGFVSKISYGGERLIASTFYGHHNYDQLYFVRTGRHNEVFLFGQSKNSGNALIHNAAYNVPNAGMLMVRMLPDLSGLRWSTVFGTAGRINLSPTAFAADICNRVYAAGWGRDFVGYNNVQWNTVGTTGMETTADAYSTTTDGQDFYILCIDADANGLEYGSFFGQQHTTSQSGGGDHVDGGTSRFDRLATLYQSVCASCGGTQGFPTTAGAWSDSNRATNCNNALFRFNVNSDFPVAEFVPPPAGCAPYTVDFQNTGRGNNYHWDFGDGTTSTLRDPSHTFAQPGLYTITLVADLPSGCSTTDTMSYTLHVIGSNPPPAQHNIACNNSLVQIGPRPQLGATYQWLTPGVSDATVANPWVADSGIYLLRVSATGCSEVDTFIVKSYNLVQQFIPTVPRCHDSVNGSLLLQLGTGLEADSVILAITPTAPFTAVAGSGVWYRFDSLAADIDYTVSASGYGCSYERTFSLQNPEPPRYSKEADTILCNDSCSASIYLAWTAGTPSSPMEADTLLEGLCPGNYQLRLTDQHGCPIIDSTLVVRSHAVDSLHAWANRNEIYLGESVQLHATAVGQDNIEYHWSPEASLDRPTEQHPLATPTDTLMVYTVTITDGVCIASDTVCIHCTDVLCGAPEFIIPNAFTPNGDGINDRLCFNAEILTEFHIALFNRWGQCVYESNDASECWDGTFRNAPCLSGVYTYTCHIRCHNGIENDFKGDLTLLR